MGDAGFTQGAFYGYYPDKAALFNALASDAADSLMEQFKAAQQVHYDLNPEDKTSQCRSLVRSCGTVCMHSVWMKVIG